MGTSASSLGDVASAILRTATDGAERVQIVGPPSTADSVLALRHAMLWSHPIVFASDLDASRTCFVDENIAVIGVCCPKTCAPNPAQASRGRGSSATHDKMREQMQQETEQQPGKENRQDKGLENDDDDDDDDDDDSDDNDDSDDDDDSDVSDSPAVTSSDDDDDEDDDEQVPQPPKGKEIAPSLPFYVRDWSVYPRAIFNKPRHRFTQPQQPQQQQQGDGETAKEPRDTCVECEALWPRPFVGFAIRDNRTGHPLVVAINIACLHVLRHCSPSQLPSRFNLCKRAYTCVCV